MPQHQGLLALCKQKQMGLYVYCIERYRCRVNQQSKNCKPDNRLIGAICRNTKEPHSMQAKAIHQKSRNVCGFCSSVLKNLRKRCVNSHDKILRQKCVNHRNSIFVVTKKGIHLLTTFCQNEPSIYVLCVL